MPRSREIRPQRVVRLGFTDTKWTADAAVPRGELVNVLGTPEVREEFFIGPATVTQLRPFAELGAVAPDVNHGVDRRGAAQALATWLVALALRFGLGCGTVGLSLYEHPPE